MEDDAGGDDAGTGTEVVYERYVFLGDEAPAQVNTYVFKDNTGRGGRNFYATIDGEFPPMKFLEYTIRKGRGRGSRPRYSVDALAPNSNDFLTRVVLSDPSLEPVRTTVLRLMLEEFQSELLHGREILEQVRTKVRSGSYKSAWKDLLTQSRAAFYFFPEVLQTPLDYAPHCGETIFLFSYKQLKAYYLCMFKYPESACFSPIMKRRIKQIDASLSASARDSSGREKYRLPELNGEQWRRFSTEQADRLEKWHDKRESIDWRQPFFPRAVDIYSNVLLKLLRECRNTFVTESMLANKMGWANGTEGVRAREAIGFLRTNGIIREVPKRAETDPLFDPELDCEDRYALRWVYSIEEEVATMLSRLRTADPAEFMHSVVRDGVAQRSATYRTYWLNETQREDGLLPHAPDDDQRNCISMMLDKPVSMGSGPPGTGKSFVTAILIRMLIEAFYAAPKHPDQPVVRFEVATPTARAAGAMRRQLEQVGVFLEDHDQDICTLQCVHRLVFFRRSRPTDITSSTSATWSRARTGRPGPSALAPEIPTRRPAKATRRSTAPSGCGATTRRRS